MEKLSDMDQVDVLVAIESLKSRFEYDANQLSMVYGGEPDDLTKRLISDNEKRAKELTELKERVSIFFNTL